MTLKGEARKAYMRAYMQRRRAAGKATAADGATTTHDKRIADLIGQLAQARARVAQLEKLRNEDVALRRRLLDQSPAPKEAKPHMHDLFVTVNAFLDKASQKTKGA